MTTAQQQHAGDTDTNDIAMSLTVRRFGFSPVKTSQPAWTHQVIAQR